MSSCARRVQFDEFEVQNVQDKLYDVATTLMPTSDQAGQETWCPALAAKFAYF